MKKTLALPYLAFASALLLGQTSSPGQITNPPLNRFERLSKRKLPPTLVAPLKDPGTAARKPSNCVYPSPTTRSLSIGPCQTSPPKLSLFPAFKRTAPTPKSAPPHGAIR
jgi:hypothetical protein